MRFCSNEKIDYVGFSYACVPTLEDERRVSAVLFSHISFTYYANNDFLWVYEPCKIVILYMFFMHFCIGMYLIFQENIKTLNTRKSLRIAQNALESLTGQFSKAQFFGESGVYNGGQNSHFAHLLI